MLKFAYHSTCYLFYQGTICMDVPSMHAAPCVAQYQLINVKICLPFYLLFILSREDLYGCTQHACRTVSPSTELLRNVKICLPFYLLFILSREDLYGCTQHACSTVSPSTELLRNVKICLPFYLLFILCRERSVRMYLACMQHRVVPNYLS